MIIKEIEKAGPKSCYFLFGNETFLLEKSIEYLKEKFISKEFIEYNFRKFNLKDDNFSDIINFLSSYSFFQSEKKIAVIDIGSSAEMKISREDEIVLKDYLTNPSDFSILVFKAHLTARQIKDTELHSILEKRCRFFEMRPLEIGDIQSLVKERISKEKKDISMEALNYLIDSVGKDICKLMSEVEKILIFIEKKDRIDVEDVESLVEGTRSFEAWELTNSILAENIEKSLKVFNRLIFDGNDLLKIFSYISKGFNNYYRAKLMILNGYNRDEIIKELRITYNKYKFFNSLEKIEMENLMAIQKLLIEADIKLKTTVSSKIMIEKLIIDIIEVGLKS
ncbi:MAG: DNA polymerase III subunit delta [Acidobacteriota bacterium]